MDSPTSEQSQTRYGTPAADLDDHRRQPSTRPRTDTISNPSSPQIPQSPAAVSSSTRLNFLQVNDGLLHAGSISRDFEQAIVDDDKSGNKEIVIDRRGSLNPGGPRRGTVRKGQNHASRSRDSSTSSRSSSPANSVDAFADPRRRERANTVGSRAPSELELGLKRTISRSTHHRQPTVDGSIRDLDGVQDDHDSLHTPAQEDVCFPTPDESSKTSTSKIDFEELDEFVVKTSKPKSRAYCQKLSFSSQNHRPRIFDGLRNQAIPKIVTESSGSETLQAGSECAIDDSETIMEEKKADILDARETQDCGQSLVERTRYSFFSSELEQTIHAADFPDLISVGETCRDLFELPEEGGVWWLDVLDPTREELHAFQRAFGIHRLTTEDILTQEAREKVELFKQYYFVCFRSFSQMDKTSEDYMDPVNVYMVVFREGILTFTYTPSPHAANVRKRIGTLRDYMALTADWVCYAMIDNIVDTFGPPIHDIETEADGIEDQVFIARTEDFSPMLRQIGECRKKVMSLMRLLGGKADVIKGFAKRCNEEYSVTPRGEIGLYLGDIQDHVVTMMSNLGHFEKMLSRSHSNYLAQLSVDNIAQGNRANAVLSKITLLASILVPLNLITGLFGMNVNVPGKSSGGLGWFFGILGVIAFVVLASLATGRRYRLL